MSITPEHSQELLIPSVSPQNLERGDLWFAENLAAIKKSAQTNPWWRDNALFLEKDLVIKPSLLVRRLMDMGYERASSALGKGIFSVRGGIIDIWPIQNGRPYAIEFSGNAVAAIHERERPAREAKPRYHRGFASRENAMEKLEDGAYVVHADHGIGIFRGIQSAALSPSIPLEKKVNQQISYDRTRNVDERSFDFYKIEYAAPGPGREPDTLLVPRHQPASRSLGASGKERLTPYVGFETPRVHRLGGGLWLKIRRRAKEEAEKLARRLLELYGKRHQARRPPYEGNNEWQDMLRASFPFEETPDQLRAEEEIAADMARAIPMDRILCGDVGFGKTEVALRAALAAIASGKQVAVLAPTTVLAAQHEKTFLGRFGGLPVRIAMLSRLTRREKEKEILKELTDGRMDCVIGTHRLFSRDVAFKNLGLVIIDEEQRFGVRQKERFKEMRNEIDVLSLSATPIPRTLSLAMARLRDISLLSAPPPERKAIKTMILPRAGRIIRDAISHELARGGQVYFLHNRIETIGAARENLLETLKQKTRSLPSRNDRREMAVRDTAAPRIGVIHGRMKEQELIKIMDAFRSREIDILMATTIIENGLDISSANTLIVDDATRLGLAQAHQLRGRIGRGTDQAFAYFLYNTRHLTEKAAERLTALQEYADLGAGYRIALRDLEIRGAGNILGREQSGAVNKVGLNLYCQTLADAVEDLLPER